MSAAAARARRRTSARSSPVAVAWPSLRPGRTALPYRWILTDGSAMLTSASASVSSDREEPSTFAITVQRARAVVSPSGRSSTARRCCSNWLVTDPSIVQWPELWGRIASSLTTTEPPPPATPGSSKSSTARTPVTPRPSATATATRLACCSTTGSRSGAGATTTEQTPSSWIDSTTGQVRTSPEGDRATRTASSRVKSTFSSTSSAGPSTAASNQSATSSTECTTRTPLPS